MSSVASVEFAHSPEELAGLIDRELADVASHLPSEVMTSPLGIGTLHEIHHMDGVGDLRAMYLGFLAGPHKLGSLFDEDRPYDRYCGVRIVATADQYQAFWQDFALDYRHRAKVIEPTSATEMVETLQVFPTLSLTVQSLHQAYMDRVHAAENVVNLARYARSRVPDGAQSATS